MPATNNNGYFIRSDTKPPCTPNCKDRKKLCHTECKKYIDWKNKYEAQRKAIFDYDMQFEVVDSYKIERTKQKKER